MSQCYTLYIHDENESLDSIDDDLPEPTAFQVPVDMKWHHLQDLIASEVGSKSKMNFTYIDDENDMIKIDSQDEYKTALDLCNKMRRDLHIFATKNGEKKKRKTKMRERKKEKKPSLVLPPPDLDKQEDEVEILRPPGEEVPSPIDISEPPIPYEEIESKSVPTSINAAASAQIEETVPQASPAAVRPKLRHKGAMLQEDVETSLLQPKKDPEETVPMVVNGSMFQIIRKEVLDVVGEEVNDIWRFITALKRDVNTELDTLGEHIEAINKLKGTTQPGQEDEIDGFESTQVNEAASADEKSEPQAAEKQGKSEQEETKYNSFAATFICESLLDGSVVHTGEGFEKHWVFRNDGGAGWNENTKLYLLDEMCDPTTATGNSLSKWGAKNKSVTMPPLKRGESGVVCAEHVAPAHACNYTSSWRLSHDENQFGPRVWCNVRVVSESSVDADKNLGSFEVVAGEKSARKSLNADGDLQGSLVPQEKLQVEVKSPKHDECVHNDNSIMSFNMTDISDGAKYIEGSTQDETPYNPAITSVETKQEESASERNEDENVGASVDSAGSASPVLVTPDLAEPEVQDEEPKTLENEDQTENLETKEETLASQEEEENAIDNFTEQVVENSVESSNEDEEEENEGSSPGRISSQTSTSEDLHSVDYNMVDDTMSMMSNYESDFVVVPLPECFDVNKPLNVSESEEVKEELKADELPVEKTEPNSAESQPIEDEVQQPPSVEESSESEVESQPSSTTCIKEYKSEDSLPLAPKGTQTSSKSPITQSPATSLSPKVNLVPAFKLPENVPPKKDEDDESLTEKITKEFDAFLSNPQHPIETHPQPKISMNEMIFTKPKVAPAPRPVPSSVLNMDQPYQFPDTTPEFPPFEQGWRRNPIPLPRSVLNSDGWAPEPNDTQRENPASTFKPNVLPPEIPSTFPPEPFAVASPSLSYPDPQEFHDAPQPRRRPPSPDIPLADDFYPPGLNPNDEEEDFRTPPPSPLPRGGSIELSPLDQLYEMGFHDIDLNHDIFDKCQQDLNRTVQALILRAEADDDMVA